MKKSVKYRIQGYHMPEYIIDVLTGGYTDTFLPMSIFKERDSYIFLYDKGNLQKLNVDIMNRIQKINLIKTLINIYEKNNNFLIPGRAYKLDTSMIYYFNEKDDYKKMRIMYYPDLKGVSFYEKLTDLVKDIFHVKDGLEENIAKIMIDAIESKDMNRLRRYIDKKIIQS